MQAGGQTQIRRQKKDKIKRNQLQTDPIRNLVSFFKVNGPGLGITAYYRKSSAWLQKRKGKGKVKIKESNQGHATPDAGLVRWCQTCVPRLAENGRTGRTGRIEIWEDKTGTGKDVMWDDAGRDKARETAQRPAMDIKKWNAKE